MKYKLWCVPQDKSRAFEIVSADVFHLARLAAELEETARACGVCYQDDLGQWEGLPEYELDALRAAATPADLPVGVGR